MKVRGRSLGADEFTVVSAEKEVPPDQLAALLHGRRAGLLVRGAIDDRARAALLDRFWHSPGLTRRGGGVQGHFVGAYHYGAPLEQYLDDVEKTAEHVRVLLGREDPVGLVMGAVHRAVEPAGVTVRLAAHGGRPAGLTRTVSWRTGGSNLLDPHEDASQLHSPDLAGFEGVAAFEHGLTAANIYLNMPVGGGHLRIWNVVPDEPTKRAFGVEQTGYYYPEPALDGVPYVDVHPAAGDILFVNGHLVHAVVGYGGDADLGAERVSMNFVIGFVDEDTVVSWA